jgi:transcription antitermination factor NusG
MAKVKQERCESCFQAFEMGTLVKWKEDMVCKGCFDYHNLRTKTQRCEHCNTMVTATALAKHGDEDWCFTCRKTVADVPVFQKVVGDKVYADRHADKNWYAVAIYGSDLKAKAKITKQFRKEGLSDTLGRIIIPRVKQTKVTKNSYEVITHEGKVVGHISADDYETAMILAKERFENRKGGRGSYKPSNVVEEFDRVEKVLDGKRVTYHALSKSDKIMGVLRGMKGPKQALEQAKILYAPEKPKNQGPRAVTTEYVEVAECRLVKSGGREMEQNVRAMPGYILIQLKDDAKAFLAVKTATRGIVLPFTEPMTYEDVEEAEMMGEMPAPVVIPNEQIRRLIEKPAVVQATNYNVGERIKIIGGTWAGLIKETTVRGTNGSRIVCNVSMMGREVEVEIEKVHVAKA